MHASLEQLYNKKIIVAMSGGVDSSVTAALLRQAGAKVQGVFMRLTERDTRHQEEEARAVAAHLDIPLAVVDLREAFQRQVLDYFAAAYLAGTTPNPCVICNRQIKCGVLLDQMVPCRGELLATGHYARLLSGAHGQRRLLRGRDCRKDQSYFLCRLTRQQLQQLVFPLGDYAKAEVYELAARFGITGRHGAESQDICFLQEQSVADFLASRYPTPSAGPIVTRAGCRLGTHQGIHRYTIGQRRGLGIPAAEPYYVIALDASKNIVVVGQQADLFQVELLLGEVHWLSGRQPSLPHDYQVKIRYRHEAAPALATEANAGRLRLVFDAPQRAITPGQFAVLYEGDEVVGSGEIVSVAQNPPKK